MTSFEIVIERVFMDEGGYINDPKDPGGETNFGISKRSYPTIEIKNLTREQAAAIYKRDFWDPIQLDNAPFGIAEQLMDFAVNSGISTSVRALQRAVGVADDGVIGPHTTQAILNMQNHDVIMRFLAERIDFMTRCKNWKDACTGWMRRIAQQLRYGADDV